MAFLIHRTALVLLPFVLGHLVLAGALAETGQPLGEYQVKAAFLFNFAKFVEWPAGARAGQGFLFVCVLGRDPFGPVLEELIQGKRVNGRPLRAKRISRPEEVPSCHMLFISGSEGGRLEEILSLAREASVLTVSDVDRFVQRGGVINFLKGDKKIRFEINPDAAARAGLKISSKLLQLATVVRDEKASNGK